jgi:serine/threonine-protein kinase
MIATSGVAKLLDFGIAVARMPGRDQTRTGTLKGTFGYLSPEQVLEEPLDGRSDLFSLGVLLVELLTGSRVFDADSEAGTLHRITECRPADVRGATHGLPRGLARICVKALSRRPRDRFQDGAEFASALRRYLARRGAAYWASDCAAELRGLGLFGQDAIPVGAPLHAAGDGEPVPGEREPSTSLTTTRRRSSVGPRNRAVSLPRVLMAASGLVLAALPAASLFERPGESGGIPADQPGGQPAESAAPAPTVTPLNEPRPADGEAERARVPSAPASAEPPLEEPIVRPKRAAERKRTSNSGTPPVLERSERAPGRIATAVFVDRPTVGSTSATLPRGLLVPARLTQPLAVALPGLVEAAVAEDVTANGALIVPKGSTVLCTSRRPSDGRVPLSCDTIKSGDRQLTFQGVAVGEGQHVGLRALDNEIAAGTAFVVYVNASAALR